MTGVRKYDGTKGAVILISRNLFRVTPRKTALRAIWSSQTGDLRSTSWPANATIICATTVPC